MRFMVSGCSSISDVSVGVSGFIVLWKHIVCGMAQECQIVWSEASVLACLVRNLSMCNRHHTVGIQNNPQSLLFAV